MRMDIQDEISLNDQSMDYVISVVQSIIGIRASFGKEGIAICHGNGSPFSIHGISEELSKGNLNLEDLKLAKD